MIVVNEMKIKVVVNRRHYKVSIELENEDADNLRGILSEKLNQIDQIIKDSTQVWHMEDDLKTREFVSVLPNGSARFQSNVVNRIDQLILLMDMAGRRGIETQDAARLLNVPVNTITGYYGREAYRGLFVRTEEGRYTLSPNGITRLAKIAVLKSTDEDLDNENES